MAPDIETVKSILAPAERVLVVTHDHPDPDALASAYAMTRLVRALGEAKCLITCEGIVGRAENRALKRELRLKLTAPWRLNWKLWPVIVLVDTQPRTGNNCIPKNRTPQIVIDHHPLRRTTRGRYLDIRPEIGACATMMANYLEAFNVPIDAPLAAGLCYAISSETQDMAREATAKDTETYSRLYVRADKKMLGRVMHPALKHTYYATLSHALLAAFTYGNIIGAHLGPTDHPDSVSLVADLLLRHERNTWSIATGTYKGAMHVSLRTLNRSAHAGDSLRKILAGLGRAGGHGQMAGGRIDLKGAENGSIRELQDEIVQRLIKVVRSSSSAAQVKPLISPEEFEQFCRLSGRADDGNIPKNDET
jgi:nanoRNase/pAp phosphatase (c-di-AMP/oligoRNAs hydrolase)